MRVTIVQESLREYRVPFYEQLRAELASDGIELQLLVGMPDQLETTKGDVAQIPWAEKVSVTRLGLANRNLVWQPGIGRLVKSDLVIVEQASRHILNYLLLALRYFGGPKVAFWGHGRNLAVGNSSPLGEWLKRITSARVDWWFAYNDFSSRIVRDMGYPSSRITSVMNTISTDQLQLDRGSISEEDVMRVRADAGISSDAVGVFIGSLYPNRKLKFLLETALVIRQRIPNFQLIVIGAGPDAQIIEAAAEAHPWILFVGRKTGENLAILAKAGKLVLLPTSVGLAAIDSFALGRPIVSLMREEHGPEFSYLVHGENAWLVDSAADGEGITLYADAVVGLLEDDDTRGRLERGCTRAAATYTLENMVRQFSQGVRRALAE